MCDDNHLITDINLQDKYKETLSKISLQGQRVNIRNLKAEDYPAFEVLFTDEKTLYYYLPSGLKTYSGTALEELMSDWNDLDTAFVFTVLHKQKPIGVITCESLDFEMKHAEVGIALLSPAVRGQGLAAEAMTIFIDFLFRDLRLHRINARIISGNLDSFKLFERLGFSLEGRQSEYVVRGSEYLDMNIFGLLAKDWLQKDSK